MPVWGYVLIGIIDFLIISLAVMFIITYRITYKVFLDWLVRTTPDKWGRECSCVTDADHVKMFETGLEWGDENRQYCTEVSIVSDGLKLVGEYFDFGFDKCVLIEQGRAESLLYDYYFAKPYKEAGCNVLVIDTRANGKSEGKYVGVGIPESRDIPRWINYITETYPANKEFYIHGICIGSAAAVLAAAKDDFPTCVRAIIAEGTFHSFYESFKEHLIELHKPTFPIMMQIRLICKIHIGIDIKKQSPINCIDKIKVPFMLLCGKEDIYSRPAKCQSLFDKCSSEQKKIVWFDKGGHSHLRIINEEKYDNEVKTFIKETTSL